jgi:2-furoyl-CoA dehydrogenase large subunit
MNAEDRKLGGQSLLGRKIRRKEDVALLTGKGRYADDVAAPAGTLYAHVVRSPHAHASIKAIDTTRASAMPGVAAVITGEDIRRLSGSFLLAVKEPIPQWALAIGKVRYAGEPVALVVAADRYLAEDAAERVQIEYEPLPAVVDPLDAIKKGAPVLHEDVGANELPARRFVYGDPERAFAEAHVISP